MTRHFVRNISRGIRSLLQAVLPLLKKAAASEGAITKYPLGKASIAHITPRLSSVGDNKMGGAYQYRVSKVC